ncbi:hypothetical protein [Brevundimonas sp.]|uniref:hypothetical protein n=1 Tax=Brevundimonas sp. TaxID=1871086 RepID=UPI002ED912C3
MGLLVSMIAGLAALSSQAAADEPQRWDWVPIEGAIVAWATDTLPEAPTTGKVKMVRFVALSRPNASMPTAPFDGMFQQLEFDCAARTYRIEGGVYITRDFEVNGAMDPDDFRPTNPSMSEYALMAVACDAVQANGVRHTTDLRGIAQALWAAGG